MNDPRYWGSSRFWYLDEINEGLVALACASARAANRRLRRERAPTRKWQTPKPGTETPLWNTLARAVAAQLRRRGAKVRLARLLGIPRQRLHLLLVAKSASPDAERALLLLVWLQARLASIDLAKSGAILRLEGMSSIK